MLENWRKLFEMLLITDNFPTQVFKKTIPYNTERPHLNL
jgi:hypothetical protein